MAPTYGEYLRLEELLALQQGHDGSPSSDELHFIIVHQNFELWFKLVISELRAARDILDRDYVAETRIPRAVHHLRRVIETFRLMAQQWKVMETLTPQDFLNFRDKLGTASGFESLQMREMEALLGPQLLDGKPREMDGPAEPRPLVAVVGDWLARTPIMGSAPGDAGDDAVVARFIEDYLAAHAMLGAETAERYGGSPKVRARFAAEAEGAREFFADGDGVDRARAGLLFIESYRELPLLAWPRRLVDTVVELEQQMVLWRSAHARMVERIIGRRTGPGGASGGDYLDSTTQWRVFGDLWAVRTLLIRKDALPPLENAEFYGFAGDEDG